MVTEIKRSIEYFGSIDRRAKIQGVVLLGNTVKLPGLRRFLASNLGYDIIAYDSFKRLQGSGVTGNPGFRDNFLSFGPCYGLCLQTLGCGPGKHQPPAPRNRHRAGWWKQRNPG